MLVVPAVNPATRPSVICATCEFAVLQSTAEVTSELVPSPKVAVALNGADLPVVMEMLAGTIVMETGATTTAMLAEDCPEEAVIVTVPAAFALASPPLLTVTMFVLVTDQSA